MMFCIHAVFGERIVQSRFLRIVCRSTKVPARSEAMSLRAPNFGEAVKCGQEAGVKTNVGVFDTLMTTRCVT